MEPSLKHLLITRFNLSHPGWKKGKYGNEPLTNEWLLERFEIFYRYCLPSVVNQSNKNFEWFIFFDKTTKHNVEFYYQMMNKYRFIRKWYVSDFLDMINCLKVHIREELSGYQHVITTRLDNDDIIHKDFVHIIQQMYRPIEMGIIDVQLGYQFSIDSKFPDLRKYLHKSNSFLSLVETATSPQTIFSREHYDWEHVEKFVFNQDPLWIELSHKSNYVNHRQRKLPRAFRIHREFFNLPMELKLGKLDLIKYHLLNYFLDSFYSLQLVVLGISRKIKRKFKPN